MKRPIESDYTSLTAYTRALEEYCDALAQPEREPSPIPLITEEEWEALNKEDDAIPTQPNT